MLIAAYARNKPHWIMKNKCQIYFQQHTFENVAFKISADLDVQQRFTDFKTATVLSFTVDEE